MIFVCKSNYRVFTRRSYGTLASIVIVSTNQASRWDAINQCADNMEPQIDVPSGRLVGRKTKSKIYVPLGTSRG